MTFHHEDKTRLLSVVCRALSCDGAQSDDEQRPMHRHYQRKRSKLCSIVTSSYLLHATFVLFVPVAEVIEERKVRIWVCDACRR